MRNYTKEYLIEVIEWYKETNECDEDMLRRFNIFRDKCDWFQINDYISTHMNLRFTNTEEKDGWNKMVYDLYFPYELLNTYDRIKKLKQIEL